MHRFRREYYLILSGLVALVFILLAIIGGVRGYSPVPYWDMWGALDFYIKISEGHHEAWWAQHNEHRIVLARLLSWIDFSLFNGSRVFLVIFNYILVLVSFTLLYACTRERLEFDQKPIGKHAIGLLLLTLLFSWIQQENLVWPFQSSFFLAQLLPLIAFYLIHKAYVSKARSNAFFATACVTGVLSMGTLANGVITLPLMTMLAAVLRMGRRRILILAVLTLLTTLLYFYNFSASDSQHSAASTLRQHPLELLQYVLTYLGGPFYYISGTFFKYGNLLLAQTAALFLIGSSVFFTYRSLRSPSHSSLQWSLLTFLLYIGGTALATGLGRLTFGIEQSLSSRYMTPALMAWSSILVLYAPALSRRISNYPVRSISLILTVQLLFLPYQLKALHFRSIDLFERRVAALALELGVRDSKQIYSVFPFTDPILKLAKVAADKDLSIFGHPLLKDSAQQMGRNRPDRSSAHCIGILEPASVQIEDDRTVRIQGWMTHTDRKTVPEKIEILNQNRNIVGYALTGQPTGKMKLAVKPDVALAGFKGYLLSGLAGKPLILKGLNPDCELPSMVPPHSTSIQNDTGKQGRTVEANEATNLPATAAEKR